MRVFRHKDATGEIGACTVCVFTSMYWELRGEYDAFSMEPRYRGLQRV